MESYNLFIQLLKVLKIQYTSTYTNEVYQSHPYKNNLFGLQQLLRLYHIESVTLKLNVKEEISKLHPPFIAQVANDLVIVNHQKENEFHYDWYGENIFMKKSDFFNIWSGVILQPIKCGESCEPKYEEHRKTEIYEKTKFYCLLGLILLLFISSIVFWGKISLIRLCFFILSIIGSYICYLLVLKQMKIPNTNSDRICNILKQGTCQEVLSTSASKIGGFSWSEIGLSYFITSILFSTFLSNAESSLCWLSLLSIGFVGWSLWYQKFHVKLWCPLCLLVQVVLVMEFLVCANFGTFIITKNALINLCFFLFFNLLCLLIIDRVCRYVEILKETEKMKYKYAALKNREDVFKCILEKENHYPCNMETSTLYFGNRESKHLVTVFSNPYCNPCAVMHKRLQQLLDVGCCIQYVFNYFNHDLSCTNRYLIAIYQELGESKAWEIFTEWYETGKFKKDDFFKSFNLDYKKVPVEEEFEKHEKWKGITNFTATPTILYNGKEIKNLYSVEDIATIIQNEE